MVGVVEGDWVSTYFGENYGLSSFREPGGVNIVAAGAGLYAPVRSRRWSLEQGDARLAQPTSRGLPIRVDGDLSASMS